MESDQEENVVFESLELDPLVLDAIREMGYTQPTPIQSQAIPLILQKKDMIALAETGSGKTAACSIPLCHLVDVSKDVIQALILVPTRELALQYATEAQKIGKIKKVKAFALFGGEDLAMQRAKLKDGVQILVATPGRLIDFIYARYIDLTHVASLVLDEADQMLGLGFLEDLEFVMQCLIHPHQTLLFSATMPKQIKDIARRHMRSPAEVTLIGEQATPKSLKHQFCFCKHASKRGEEILKYIAEHSPSQCLIFANSRKEVEELHHLFRKNLQGVDFLHGGLEQHIRSIITGKFAKGKIRYLVATDIAARGLDFSNVTHVFNFHMPWDLETYLHRAGRTGRSGKEGICMTLVTHKDLRQIRSLLKLLPSAEWLNEPPPSLAIR